MMTQGVSGAQVATLLRELRAIVDDSERERRAYSYGDAEWRRLYERSEAAQGIGWGIETARAWPELLAILVDMGAAAVVDVVNSTERHASIGGAWDAAKNLGQEG